MSTLDKVRVKTSFPTIYLFFFLLSSLYWVKTSSSHDVKNQGQTDYSESKKKGGKRAKFKKRTRTVMQFTL